MRTTFRTYSRDVNLFETDTKGRLSVFGISMNWSSNRKYVIGGSQLSSSDLVRKMLSGVRCNGGVHVRVRFKLQQEASEAATPVYIEFVYERTLQQSCCTMLHMLEIIHQTLEGMQTKTCSHAKEIGWKILLVFTALHG